MKKDKKGFALIEILTVTVVVMVIFTLLYSNLFPLIGEYEKRVGYTDVESQYISFYMRKLYKDKAIDLGSSPYKVLYQNTSKSCALLSGSEKTKCEAIAEASGVVTMIVTNKDLTSLKAENLLAYSDLNEIVDYIKYLPKYTNSDPIENYRLIIKTLTGYATTELKTTSSGSSMTAADTIIAKVGTDGIVADSHPTTEQLQATTDYRYTGANPNNYISFNNETWRIIGVFDTDDGTGNLEKRVKIIRDSIGNIAWASDNVNDWTKASGMTLLNSGDYWNRTGSYASNGLTSDARSQIADAKWYLGGVDQYQYSTTNATQFYSYERETTVYEGRPTSWVGKVGLMYASDYGYATSGGFTNRDACLAKELYNWNYSSARGCNDNDWLYDINKDQWTLSIASSHSYGAFIVLMGSEVYYNQVESTHTLRPTVYLKSTVKITGGSGTSSSPYQIQN